MALPMQAEEEYQELQTRDHGVVKVDKISFQDGGYHIVKCPGGGYRHANGLPILNEKELRAAIPVEFLQEAIDWFRNRHEWEENPPQPIGFDRAGYPVFADGNPVEEFDDLYAFFQPGPILTAAIVALQAKKKAQEALKAPAKPKLQAAPKKGGAGKKTAGKKLTGKSAAKAQEPAAPASTA
jgi:hypothetical protein